VFFNKNLEEEQNGNKVTLFLVQWGCECCNDGKKSNEESWLTAETLIA